MSFGSNFIENYDRLFFSWGGEYLAQNESDTSDSSHPACNTKVKNLPTGLIEARVVGVADGDTYMLEPQICSKNNIKPQQVVAKSDFDQFGKRSDEIPKALETAGYIDIYGTLTGKFDGTRESIILDIPLSSEEKEAIFSLMESARGGKCVIRTTHINATELAHGEKGQEQGATSAEQLMKEMILNRFVFIPTPAKADHYGRVLLEKTFVEDTTDPGTYLDVHLKLVERGLAHDFEFTFSEEASRLEITACQEQARAAKSGIWKDDPRFQGDIHITSFHGDVAVEAEYIRIVNISSREIDLADYVLENCETKERIPLPHCKIPAGVQVQVLSGKGRNQVEYRNKENSPLTIYLGKETDLWKDSGAMIVIRRTADNKIQDMMPSQEGYTCQPQ